MAKQLQQIQYVDCHSQTLCDMPPRKDLQEPCNHTSTIIYYFNY